MSETPALNQWLHSVEAEARKRKYPNLFMAVSDPSHPLGGGSVRYTSEKETDDRALYDSLKNALHAWEKERGINPMHDWKKNPESSLYAEKRAFTDSQLNMSYGGGSGSSGSSGGSRGSGGSGGSGGSLGSWLSSWWPAKSTAKKAKDIVKAAPEKAKETLQQAGITPPTLAEMAGVGLLGAGAYAGAKELGRAGTFTFERDTPGLMRQLQRERATLHRLGGDLAAHRGTGALKVLGGLGAAAGGAALLKRMMERRRERRAETPMTAGDDMYKMSHAHLEEIQKQAASLFLRVKNGEELSFEKEASGTDPREQAIKTAAWVVCAEMLDREKTAANYGRAAALGTLLGLGGYGAATRLNPFGEKGQPMMEPRPGRALAAATVGAAGGIGYHRGRREEVGHLIDEIDETRKAIQKIRQQLPNAAKAGQGAKAVSGSLGRILAKVV